MTREQFIKIMQANGVKYDRDIEKQETEGFVNDECAALAESIYGDLFNITLYGMQNGFSKCDEDIRELTKLVASMVTGISRKAINIAKTDAKYRQIIKRANYLRKGIQMDMLNQLLNNLSACIAATDAIVSIRENNQALCTNLCESKKVLLEMKEILSHVADGTSKQAAEYQIKIFDALMDWRSVVSTYNCYSDTVTDLAAALDVAKQWQGLTATVRHPAKKGKDYYEYKDGYDDISYIISSARYMERTQGMHSQIETYKEQTKMQFDRESIEAEIAKLEEEYKKQTEEKRAQVEKYTKQIQSLLIQFQNGEVDKITVASETKYLDGEIKDLNVELADLKSDYDKDIDDLRYELKNAQSGGRIREKIAKYFEDFLKKLESYRIKDPATFVRLCETIDFNAVYGTLTNRLSAGEVDEFYVKIETVMRQVESEVAKQRLNKDNFEDIRGRMREDRIVGERVLREQEERRRQREKSRTGQTANAQTSASSADDDLAEMMKKYGMVTETPVKTEKQDVTAPLNVNNEDK